MEDIVNTLKDTPLPTILVVAGIGFLLLAISGQVAGKIAVPAARQKWAGVLGTLFLVLGTFLHVIPRNGDNVNVPNGKPTIRPNTPTEPIPLPTLRPMRVEGIWESSEWGSIQIKQASRKVSAEYMYSDQYGHWYGYLEGEVVGNTVNFVWWEDYAKGSSYDEASSGRRGDGYFVFYDNGSRLIGKWRKSDQTDWAGHWHLIRKDAK